MQKISDSLKMFINKRKDGEIFAHILETCDEPEELILDIFEIRKLNEILTKWLKEYDEQG